MGNLIGIMAQVPRGGEIIAPADVHMISGEARGMPGGRSVRARDLWHDDGMFDLVALQDAFRSDDVHEPATALVTTRTRDSLSMGQPLTPAFTQSVADIAAERGVPLFVDGARLFNASVALGVPARALVPEAASATFCLSKSLGCPVGSLIVGDAEFIHRARRARKLLAAGCARRACSRRPGWSRCRMDRTA